jgi:uncharacterized protein YggE
VVTIAVTGSATHRHRAERGTVRLGLGVEGDDRERVLRDSVALHERITAEATAHRRQGAATWWSADEVTVGPVPGTWQDDGTRASSGLVRSRSTVAVRFSDVAALARWVASAAAIDGVAVEGVEWSLSHDRRPEVERAARVAAVADAVVRAVDYADALGLGTPTLPSLWEPGLRPGAGGAGAAGGPALFARAVSSTAGDDAPLAFALVPAEVEMHGEVSADFVA